jgi:hypothetical protein
VNPACVASAVVLTKMFLNAAAEPVVSLDALVVSVHPE